MLVCDDCRQEAERTNHLDLYSTYRSIIFGCEHSIADLKRDVEEQVSLSQVRDIESKTPAKFSPRIVKHSKVEYKRGRFVMRGDRSGFEK